MRIEELALDLMTKSKYVDEKQEEFSSTLTEEEEYNFDLELAEFERLDVEAQSIAPTFYVR